MERRRRGQLPFKRGRPFAPWIGGGRALAAESFRERDEEDDQPHGRDVGTDRRDEIPAGESVGIVGGAARHSRQPQEVLGEEDEIDADEHQPEMQFSQGFAVHVAGHLREPVVEAREDGEDRAQGQHVVEVGDHEIDVVQRAVYAGAGDHDPGDAADGEEQDEADGKQHRRLELDRPAPHRGQPGKHLHARRNGDHHRSEGEVALAVDGDAARVHMMRPDEEADHADRHHRIGHADIAEDRLLGEGRDDVADDAEAGQDHDVDLRMAEEPEQMLVEDRVAAAVGNEECRAEVAVREQHRDRAGQHRQRHQQHEGGHQHRPGEKRHLVHRHARRAHVEDGGDEVDRAEDRRRSRKVD